MLTVPCRENQTKMRLTGHSKIVGSSQRNLLTVTYLAPTVWRALLDIWKICGLLGYRTSETHCRIHNLPCCRSDRENVGITAR